MRNNSDLRATHNWLKTKAGQTQTIGKATGKTIGKAINSAKEKEEGNYTGNYWGQIPNGIITTTGAVAPRTSGANLRPGITNVARSPKTMKTRKSWRLVNIRRRNKRRRNI